MSDAPGRLTARPTRTVPTAVLGLLVLAAGALAVWLLGGLLIDGDWPQIAGSAITTAGGTLMGDPVVLVIGVTLALLGLVLLLTALAPGDPARRAVLADETPGDTVISRRDLALRVRRRVEQVDGVQSVRTSLSGSTLRVEARTPVDDLETVTRRTRAAVDHAVEELRPARTVRPRVTVTRAR